MAQKPSSWRISRKLGKFHAERALILITILVVFAGVTRGVLETHPQHNPLALLDLRDPVGMATGRKLAALRQDTEQCRQVLERSEVAYSALDPAGEGACLRMDRTRLDDFPLAPAAPPVTCPLATALEMWRIHTLEPASEEIFGSKIATIEHLGAFSCRRTYGRSQGAWSEHATGNAIDIAGFVLEDGRRISVLRDWQGDDGGNDRANPASKDENKDERARFLQRARGEACGLFATVLSPDYNAAHADHFHLDQTARWRRLCR
ncbi:MAG: extensin-like domain-containing protein [Erythrobacter sp.]